MLLHKAGEIIPEIIRVTEKGPGPAFAVPEVCPSCGTKIVREAGRVAWICPNHQHCAAQVLQSVSVRRVGKRRSSPQ